MITKVADNSTVSQTQQLIKLSKGASVDDRNAIVLDPNPPNLTIPGLSFMKQVHLFTKWRPLLPVGLQDITCPQLFEDVVMKGKSSLKQKRKLKGALMFDGFEDGDNRTRTKRTRSGANKVTRKRMTLLTEGTFDEDTNRDKSLISNLEYATGGGNLSTQPPPPTIATDVKSLADDVEDSKNDDGVLLHESDDLLA